MRGSSHNDGAIAVVADEKPLSSADMKRAMELIANDFTQLHTNNEALSAKVNKLEGMLGELLLRDVKRTI